MLFSNIFSFSHNDFFPFEQRIPWFKWYFKLLPVHANDAINFGHVFFFCLIKCRTFWEEVVQIESISFEVLQQT